ncbi:S-layer homology domain-containing protein [Halalkalibacter urbisdiaboli]|uniref:S-layer homology domain-containing protein n=1 Tax=Halalkalibacter urbisdiaboli TaxID=1960589 RepID=UPI000B432413|nr:S-layer homology domain-containing protein [Halalkalibacter urbisdiaboli]
MRSLLIILIILGTIFPSYHSSAFAQSDDLTGHSLETEMRSAIEKGILRGYGPGRYGPDDSVTRAQFATFLGRALNLPGGSSSFDDVPETHPHFYDISRAVSAGIVGGYPGNVYKPEAQISRQEMAVMIDRALTYKGITRTSVALNFNDLDLINPSFRLAVAHNVYFGIIRGIPLGGGKVNFGPRNDATRAHAAAFIERMLHVISTGGETTELYRVASVSQNGSVSYQPNYYMTYAEAAANQGSNQLIYQGLKLLKMKDGMVAANPPVGQYTVTIRAENKTTQQTYVAPGTELEYISSDENWVHVRYADQTGYIRQQDALLIPTPLMQGKSHYENSNGVLVHRVFDPLKNTSGTYLYGYAPTFMQPGQKYYSLNGRDFKNASGQNVGQAFQYFNYLPLRSKTNYTADDLNRYILSVETKINGKVVKDESPLRELGHVFIKAQETYGINALYLFAKAIHESSYGLSEIAIQRKNLFGYRAYDSDPLGNAYNYESFEDSIMGVARSMNERYLTPEGAQYRGAVLGNKSHGMNINYASDPLWGQKIAGHMYRADAFLGKKDHGVYKVARTTESLNARPQPNTKLAPQYRYPGSGYYVVIVEETKQADGTWYKILSDHKDHEFAYVHGDYVREVQFVK